MKNESTTSDSQINGGKCENAGQMDPLAERGGASASYDEEMDPLYSASRSAQNNRMTSDNTPSDQSGRIHKRRL